jgi:hypothetical protein
MRGMWTRKEKEGETIRVLGANQDRMRYCTQILIFSPHVKICIPII